MVLFCLFACKSHRTSHRYEREASGNIEAMRFRTVDSVWNLLTENTTLRISFYPKDSVPDPNPTPNNTEVADGQTAVNQLPLDRISGIEISKTSTVENSTKTTIDSTDLRQTTNISETIKDRESEIKNYNAVWGWLVLAGVAALAVLYIKKRFL